MVLCPPNKLTIKDAISLLIVLHFGHGANYYYYSYTWPSYKTDNVGPMGFDMGEAKEELLR